MRLQAQAFAVGVVELRATSAGVPASPSTGLSPHAAASLLLDPRTLREPSVLSARRGFSRRGTSKGCARATSTRRMSHGRRPI